MMKLKHAFLVTLAVAILGGVVLCYKGFAQRKNTVRCQIRDEGI